MRMTRWLITWGTYGTRLHGGVAPTVVRGANQRGQPVMERNERFEQRERSRMRARAVHLSPEQCIFVEDNLPSMCERGGWRCAECSGASDHVHVVLDAPCYARGKTILKLLKRWITQAMEMHWPRPDAGTWWAERGSARAARDEAHGEAMPGYVRNQRFPRK